MFRRFNLGALIAVAAMGIALGVAGGRSAPVAAQATSSLAGISVKTATAAFVSAFHGPLFMDVSVACDSGNKVLAGGSSIPEGRFSLTRSYPSTSTTWSLRVTRVDSLVGGQVSAWAICYPISAFGPADLTVRTATFGVNALRAFANGTATCEPGRRVLAGGHLIDLIQKDDYNVTQSEPAGTNGWTIGAWATGNASQFSDATVTVYALCYPLDLPGPAAINVQTASFPIALQSGQYNGSARCGSGFQALGGGYRINQPTASAREWEILRSLPSAPNTWSVGVDHNGALAATGVVHVVCYPAVANVAVVELCEHVNYAGACRQFTDDTPDLRSLVVRADTSVFPPRAITQNDFASSIRIAGTASVAVYSDINYGGRCETLSASDPDLRNNAIGNDAISSIRPFAICPPAVSTAERR